MRQLTFNSVFTILEKHKKTSKKATWNQKVVTEIRKKVTSHFEEKSILGLDIYQYSQFPPFEQSLIPHLFKSLYLATIQNCMDHEPFIFQKLKKDDFTDHFIDAGDGGFQIFESPFHAVIFAIYFQANIKRYNSGRDNYHYELRQLIGEITLRYSITYGTTYRYEKGFYGPSIITNSRIMSKDKLNRVLIDENTNSWFTKVFNGIENLQAIDFNELSEIELFNKYKKTKDEDQSLIFAGSDSKILSVHILKIGQIRSKLDVVSIHSLHIQAILISLDTPGIVTFTISLGNLNSLGIGE